MSKNAAVRGNLAEIGSRVTGQVTKVEVDVGDRVVANQILVRMEDRRLQAEVQEAQADVAGLERTLEVERLNIAHDRRKIGQQGQEAAARRRGCGGPGRGREDPFDRGSSKPPDRANRCSRATVSSPARTFATRRPKI